MLFEYSTERMNIRILSDEQAMLVLDFYNKNHEVFDKWEERHSENFFSLKYQEEMLRAEFQLFLQGRHIRFYLFDKNNPLRIIGSVSFSNIQQNADRCCKIGYKLIPGYWHKGFATEALSFLLPVIHKDCRIHRIEADILPSNEASKKLASRLGFEYEGIARSSHCINGVWCDHERYAFIFNDN